MNKKDFEKALGEYIKSSPDNFVKKAPAFPSEMEGLRIFDEPLIGYASAEDPYFLEAKNPDIIGAHYITPKEWLAGARTIICIFLPFTEQIRTANSQNMAWPADEWLLARIEGQAFQNKICHKMESMLKDTGFSALSPMIDSRIGRGSSLVTDKTDQKYHTSNWSERHAAYAAGLGTFGLSRGLITQKGTAGRYLSIITTAVFEPDKRSYTGIYDYCNFCGLCALNCPVKAISIEEKTKKHYPCSVFLDSTKEKHDPYYGCGKCQVKVPCESKAPNI